MWWLHMTKLRQKHNVSMIQKPTSQHVETACMIHTGGCCGSHGGWVRNSETTVVAANPIEASDPLLNRNASKVFGRIARTDTIGHHISGMIHATEMSGFVRHNIAFENGTTRVQTSVARFIDSHTPFGIAHRLCISTPDRATARRIRSTVEEMQKRTVATGRVKRVFCVRSEAVNQITASTTDIGGGFTHIFVIIVVFIGHDEVSLQG